MNTESSVCELFNLVTEKRKIEKEKEEALKNDISELKKQFQDAYESLKDQINLYNKNIQRDLDDLKNQLKELETKTKYTFESMTSIIKISSDFDNQKRKLNELRCQVNEQLSNSLTPESHVLQQIRSEINKIKKQIQKLKSK